jgi:tetratricopeptide (TPR) repeat protein
MEDNLKDKILAFNFKQWFAKERLVIIFLTLLVFAVYLNALGNGFVSDDIDGILQNPDLNNFSSFFSSPLKLLRSFYPILSAVIVQIFGKIPLPFHFLNIIFHLGTVIAIFLLVCLISDRTAAFFTAALVACHPIMTEAVTWISGGGHVMYSFFIILGLLFYILAVRKEKFLYLSLIASILALSSSEKAIIFPLLIIILALSLKIKPTNLKKLAILLIPAVLTCLLFITLIPARLSVLQNGFDQIRITLNPLVQIPVAISSYLQLIFWPKDLTFYHSEISFSRPKFLIYSAVFILFLAAMLFSWKKNKRLFFWLSFFLVSLLPTLTPLGISWIVAERYVYLGAIGIFATVGLIFSRAVQKAKNPKIVYIAFAVIIMALSWRTIVRNNDWKNQDTFWQATAKTSPQSWQNHKNLGDLYGQRGDSEKAIEEFKKAIELNPGYADAFNDLGNVYQQMGKMDLAIKSYQKAIALNPTLWQPCLNLAAIYSQQNETGLTNNYLEKALGINPKNAAFYFRLGIIYSQLKEKEKAIAEFQKALELDPEIGAQFQK